MRVVGERLHTLRIALLARTTDIGPDLLLFPNELAALQEGLEAFVRASLAVHPYLETPLLRGLFFSSGQQQGGATSRLADQLLPTSPLHGTTNAGLFLHDFFGRILPQDRHVGLPALSRNPWIKMTENLGMVAWLMLTTAIGIALTAGFFYDMRTLGFIEERYPFKATLEGKLEKDVVPLQKAMDTLVLVERRNQSWFNRLLADTADMSIMKEQLRGRFVGDFRKYILTEADIYSGTSLAAMSKSDPKFGSLIRNHVRYINLIEARRNGASFDQLAALPQRQDIGSNFSAETLARLESLFLADLAWTPTNDPYLAASVLKEQALLNDFAYADPPFAWLVGLLEGDEQLKPVTVADFWNIADSRSGNHLMARPNVAALFTLAGKEQIERFFAEMQSSVSEGQKFLIKRAAFEQWYLVQRLKAWQQFVEAFPDADRTVIGEAAWRAGLGDISSNMSPYFRLIDRLEKEFGNEPETALPLWLRFNHQFSQLRHQAISLPAGANSQQMVATINAVGGKAIQEVVSGAPKAGENTITAHLAVTGALKKFLDDLNAIAADAAQGSGQAYQLAADFHGYGVDPAIKASTLNSAVEQLANLKKLVGNTTAENEAIWRLIGGPLRFVTQYVEEQASCAVQADWESKVIFPLQTQTNMKGLMDELYGQKGSVWAFADGIAKPFLQRNSNQYTLAQTAGFSLPFTPAFLPALNSATGKRLERLQANDLMAREVQQQELRSQKDELDSKQQLVEVDRLLAETRNKLEISKAQSVVLKITAHPTSLNPDALAKPFATILSIQCASGARKISNFNFLVSDSVTWAPGQCGDVELQIRIGDLVLGKKYPGTSGLYSFLLDFRDGTRQFYADEFPTMKGKLEQLGIRQIGVKYLFDGADTLIAAVQQRESLAKLDKEKTAEKQRLQDDSAQRAKQALTTKMTPPAEPPMHVRVPVRIGMCWAADVAQQKQSIGAGEAARPEDVTSPASDRATESPVRPAANKATHEAAKQTALKK